MGEKRKLQAEIDRCLKKVTEGVDLFNEIWGKFQSAANLNQKEKFEADLKKEIKKLQRLRDQIKGWMSSNEIKDKEVLAENRRKIEQQMERFKAVERETKTKAFSKSGLTAEQKLDPKEREREEVRYWLQDMMDKINQQCDAFESEIELVEANTGKKKRLEKDKQERADECKRLLDNHKFHITRLELLLRLLDNNTVEAALIKDIKDNLEYYLENCANEEMNDYEYVYEDLGLDFNELNAQLGPLCAGNPGEEEATPSETATTASTTSPAASPGPSSTTRESSCSKDFEEKSRHASGDDLVRPAASRQPSVSRSVPNTPFKFTSQSSQDGVSMTSPAPIVTPPPPPANSIPYNSVAAGNKSATKVTTPSPYKPNDQSPESFSQQLPSPLKGISPRAEETPPSMGLPPAPPVFEESPREEPNTIAQSVFNFTAAPVVESAPPPPTSAASQSFVVATQPPSQVSLISHPTPLHVALPSMVMNGPGEIKKPEEQPDSLRMLAQSTMSNVQQQIPNPSLSGLLPSSLVSPSSNSIDAISNLFGSHTGLQPQEAKIPPYLGASPLGKQQLSQNEAKQYFYLEAATAHPPQAMDSEKLKVYLPRTPVQVPSYYPQYPPLYHDTLDHYQRLTPETLFFIFYYIEGTKAQYLAATALKKQSWRFHTKYKMWFQRHEEPKTITDEFEQGTYIYFDFEKWAQRRKEGFMFEYKYLEDKEL